MLVSQKPYTNHVLTPVQCSSRSDVRKVLLRGLKSTGRPVASSPSRSSWGQNRTRAFWNVAGTASSPGFSNARILHVLVRRRAGGLSAPPHAVCPGTRRSDPMVGLGDSSRGPFRCLDARGYVPAPMVVSCMNVAGVCRVSNGPPRLWTKALPVIICSCLSAFKLITVI